MEEAAKIFEITKRKLRFSMWMDLDEVIINDALHGYSY
jgi:hypothetical protein